MIRRWEFPSADRETSINGRAPVGEHEETEYYKGRVSDGKRITKLALFCNFDTLRRTQQEQRLVFSITRCWTVDDSVPYSGVGPIDHPLDLGETSFKGKQVGFTEFIMIFSYDF